MTLHPPLDISGDDTENLKARIDKPRAMLPNVPVCMVTGTPSADTANESLCEGAFVYLFKPIRQKAL